MMGDAALNGVELAGDQKPMVTREQYDQARAVLDALPSGIYIKCSQCGGWYRGGTVYFSNGMDITCEGCS